MLLVTSSPRVRDDPPNTLDHIVNSATLPDLSDPSGLAFLRLRQSGDWPPAHVSPEGSDNIRQTLADLRACNHVELLGRRSDRDAQLRGRMRMLAALLPPMGLSDTATQLASVIGNPALHWRDVLDVLSGDADEIAVHAYQTAVETLFDTGSVKAAIAKSGLSRRVVYDLNRFFGVTDRLADDQFDRCFAMVEEDPDVPIRTLSKTLGVSVGKASKLRKKAHAVLEELS